MQSIYFLKRLGLEDSHNWCGGRVFKSVLLAGELLNGLGDALLGDTVTPLSLALPTSRCVPLVLPGSLQQGKAALYK